MLLKCTFNNSRKELSHRYNKFEYFSHFGEYLFLFCFVFVLVKRTVSREKGKAQTMLRNP